MEWAIQVQYTFSETSHGSLAVYSVQVCTRPTETWLCKLEINKVAWTNTDSTTRAKEQQEVFVLMSRTRGRGGDGQSGTC